MESVFSVIRLMILCGSGLLLAMGLLAHLPSSPLRNVLVKVCGYATAAFCGAYVVSPIDPIPEMFFGPFGLIDDLIAAIAGIMAIRSAWKAGKE